MDVENTAVRKFQIYGIALAFGGVVLAGLSFVVSSLVLAVGVFVLAPLVWAHQRRQESVPNLGVPTLLVGMLLLVAESGERSVFGWVTPVEIAGFVVVCGVLQVAFAPWLARYNLNVL